MPIPELMTWVGAQRRWTRMYRGRRYYISARKLGCPETKEGSLQAANQWWRDKQAEIDHALGTTVYQPAPLDDLAAAALGVPPDLFADVRRLCEQALLQALLREEEERKAGKPPTPAFPGIPDDVEVEILIDDEPEDAETIRRHEVMALVERLLFGADARLPAEVAEQLPPARVAQVERAIRELKAEPAAEPGRTIGVLAEDWLRGQESRASVGYISLVRYKQVRKQLAHFTAFLGATADACAVNSECIERFYRHSLARVRDKREGLAGGWSEQYAANVFNTSQRFVKWLWERGVIDLPKNLNGESVRFRVSPKTIATWPIEEVKRAIDEAKGVLKVSLLLMANCGCTQKDVADLLDSEVDWARGSITRKRSKTKHAENVPVVSYLLWPRTFELLLQHRSGKERVLLTRAGLPLVRSTVTQGGKVREIDLIYSKFRKLAQRTGFYRPLKQLRKTSATLLESHPVYGRITSLFLGHAPASVKDRYYAGAPQELLNDAVTWLGQQYGFISA